MSQQKALQTTEKKSILISIFARIWALWGIISFIATFLIIFIPSMLAYLMDDVKGQYYFIYVSRVWMNIWLPLIGCPLKIDGRDNFKKGENYIVTFNHNTLLDVPLSAPYVPGANKTIAKASFAKVPLFGWFYRKGSVLVNRNDDSSRVKSYEAMKAVLAQGIHMCIYPEGTRNRTSEPLKPFYDGAFKLAVETGKPIIPCIIIGTKQAMPVNEFFYLLPTKLEMHFLPPVISADKNIKALKEEVFQLMQASYVNYSKR